METINILSLNEGCELINNRFKNESEMIENLIPKLNGIIKSMYGCNIVRYQRERHYKMLNMGYYNMFIDIYLETDAGFDIVIECKNPKQIKYEIISSFSQIMSYEFLFTKIKNEKPIKFVLATSCFDFAFFEFMAMFNIKYDIIINNQDTAAYWINDLQNGRARNK